MKIFDNLLRVGTLKERFKKRSFVFSKESSADTKVQIETCKDLCAQAVEVVEKGENRDRLTFDESQRKASKTGGAVKDVVSQSFDGASREQSSRSENEQICFPKEWHRPAWDPNSQHPQARTLGECMYQYCFFGVQQRKMHQQEELARYLRLGGTDVTLKEDKHRADQWVSVALKVYDSIKFGNIPDPVLEKISCLGGPLMYLCKKKGETEDERQQRSKTKRAHQVCIAATPVVSRLPSIHVTPRRRTLNVNKWAHPNEISQLPPAREWVLYVDESYRAAKKSAGEESFCYGGDGVIAGVLFDREHPLPPLPPLHASQDSSEEQMKQADRVIDILTQSSCGVLVLPVRACAAPQGWGSALGAYIDLVLRLLPLSEDQCRLSVFIEGRDPYHTARDCQFLRDACCYRLMQSVPERARKIQLHLGIQTKDDQCNAYPDIVAHCCRMHKEEKRLAAPRFAASGWSGSCFLNYTAEFLSPLMDAFFAGIHLEESNWQTLLQENKRQPSGFVSAILQTLGYEARSDVAIWHRYLDFVLEHLNSKRINLKLLSAQLDWLTAYCPANAELPPRLRLLWLTAKLAEENHRGQIVHHLELRSEFERLSTTLFEEDAPLVCSAVLNLAVSHTNAFDFDGAHSVLRVWQKYGPEVFGLQNHGRLLSGLGQCEAFLGNVGEAVRLFMAALADFGRLSEKESAKLDSWQTSAYLVTVLMDSSIPREEGFDKAAHAYFGENLCEAAARLAHEATDETKYLHHILLRYLTSPLARSNEKAAYLAGREDWRVGYGHPWEMIEFYRALLVEDEQERMARLDSAYDIAMEGSGTLHVIAAVIDGARLLHDPAREAAYLELVAQCRSEIPALGARADILTEHVHKKYEPLELARLVLPFNFR